jgi:TonB family protein
VTLLLDSALRASVVLAAGWIATLLLGRSSADLRRAVWRLAIAATAVVPLLLALKGNRAVADGMEVLAVGIPANVLASPEIASRWSWLPAVWALGCLGLLLRLSIGLTAVLRCSRTADREAGVLYSRHTATPMTWGLIRPQIILPADARDWPAVERARVVIHETAHIEHHDWTWQLLSRLLVSVFWFHPLVWIADRGLRREAERAADDRVLAGGANAVAYAEQLFTLARRTAASIPSAAVAMVRRSTLETRVRHILHEGTNRMPAHRAKVIGLAIIASALSLSVAAVRGAQVYKVGEDGVTAPILIKKVDPAYPADAKEEKVQGSVMLEMQLSAEGVPEQITVLRSPDDRLARNAVSAVEQWRYVPAKKDGVAVRVTCTVSVVYTLK